MAWGSCCGKLSDGANAAPFTAFFGHRRSLEGRKNLFNFRRGQNPNNADGKPFGFTTARAGGHSPPCPATDPIRRFAHLRCGKRRLSAPSAMDPNAAPLRLPPSSCAGRGSPLCRPWAHVQSHPLTAGTDGKSAHVRGFFRGGEHEKSPLALASRGFVSVDCNSRFDENCRVWQHLQF